MLDSEGIDRFRALYASGDLEEAYGRPVEELIAAWGTFVDDRAKVPLTADDESMARFQFDQPSRFHRICALERARWEEQAARAAAKGKKDEAVSLLRKALAFDSKDPEKRLALLDALVEAGKLGDARTMAESVMADERAGAVNRAKAAIRRADLAYLDGKANDARDRFRKLVKEPMDEASRRRVIVIATLFDIAIPELALPLLDYVIGGKPGGAAALEMLRGLAVTFPEDALVHYLRGRRAEALGLNAEADASLAAAATNGLKPTLLLMESERLRAAMAFEDGLYVEARAHYESARALSEAAGQQSEFTDWMARAEFFAASPKSQ